MLPIVLSPETAYATKNNIVFPGSQTLATAAEVRADARIEDVLDSSGLDNLNIEVASGAIEIANP